MAKKKKKDWDGEEEKLSDFLECIGIEDTQVKKYSPYHIRVLGKRTVDIWCGSKKYYVLGSASSKEYKTLFELEEYLV